MGFPLVRHISRETALDGEQDLIWFGHENVSGDVVSNGELDPSLEAFKADHGAPAVPDEGLLRENGFIPNHNSAHIS